MITKLFSILAIIAILSTQSFSQSDSAETEMRNPRAFGISGEVGMNSLGSLLGPVATFYVKPQIALDLGFGLSSVGLRPGVRARYLFSKEKMAYTLGAGLKYGLGTGEEFVPIEDEKNKTTVHVKIKPSTFVDLTAGTDFLANNGFLLIANVGYSLRVGGKNYEVQSGEFPSKETNQAFRLVFGSGILLSISAGWGF